jgi:D-glycero-alpha-D-manno-heptose-7-phosphate kinase
MKRLAEQMIDALASGDVEALGTLVGEHWTHQRSLHPAITTERIDAIMERGRAAGAVGGKALGASGGGCVVLIAAADMADRVRAAVTPLGDVVPFAIDETGLTADPRGRVHAGDDGWP